MEIYEAKWVKGNYYQASVWHAVIGIEHFRLEYKNGRIDEGDEVKTRCYPYGHYLLEHAIVSESEEAPGPVCKVCRRKLAKAGKP